MNTNEPPHRWDTDTLRFSAFYENIRGKKQKMEIFASVGGLWCSSGLS